MHFYRTYLQRTGLPDDGHRYDATLGDAHAYAKTFDAAERRDLIVDLVDIPTDKAGVLRLLNGFEHSDFKALRTWDVTPRGGLKEQPVEDV